MREYGAREWFALARKRAGYTQKELAEKLGIHQSYLTLVERGRVMPLPMTAKKICEPLDVDWRRFYEEKEEKKG